jgi:hypothetical protein
VRHSGEVTHTGTPVDITAEANPEAPLVVDEFARLEDLP